MKPGERVGNYTIERRIGRGSMGVVYLATQAGTRRRCALKVLGAEHLEDESARGRFQNEVRSLAQLRGHPSIVEVLDAGLTSEQEPYFVMEFVEGVTLREAMTGRAPLPELLEALEQVSRALAHAHGLGFVHRDVKPENVLLGRDGVARLTDFGIASSLYRTRRLTETGSILGTLVYMAPEQANPQLGRVGPWSDAYSLGAVLYEALTGRPPLEGKNTVELLTKLLLQSGEVRPPRELAPDVDPRLEAMCLKALAWSPAARYRTLTEVADELAATRPPVSGTRWAALHAAVHAGTSVADLESPVPRGGVAAPVPESESTVVDPGRRAAVLAQIARKEPGTTLAEEDDPSRSASSADLPQPEPAGSSRGLVILAAVAILSVLLVAVGLGVVHLRRVSQAGSGPVAPGRLDLGPLRELLARGKWDELLREGERLRAEHGPSPDLDGLIGQAHQGRVLGAFRAEDVARARELLPAGWEGRFPELPWILALTGDPARALQVMPEDVAPEHLARVAAWAGDEAVCRAALEKLGLDRARALAWELSQVLPALRPEGAATRAPRALLPGDEPAEGWAAAARGEEALALGLLGLAAVAFDDAHRGEAAEESARLQGLLGAARVELARGRLEQAAGHVGEAFRWVRHPLDQARCLGLAALVTVGLGKEHEGLAQPTGGDALGRAGRFAPLAPEVATAAWNRRLLDGWAGDRPSPLIQEDPRPWPGPERERGARRGGKGAPLAEGEASFAQAELQACERGLDGAEGLLVARGARLAALSRASGWRPGAQEAQRLLEVAVRLRPASPALRVAQARAALPLRQQERALDAIERAARLSPGDPEVLLERARVLRAGLDRAGLDADLAELKGGLTPDLAKELAAGLEPVLAAWRAARDAAPAAHELSRVARVGAAWTLFERARRLKQAGDPAASAALAELATELGPLLSGLDAAGLVAARGRLVQALEAGDDRAAEQVERELAGLAGRADAPARQALLLSGLAGQPADGQAWLTLAGDLPARALLLLRRAEASPRPGQEAWLQRARRLAPELPQLALAEELRTGIAREPGSFLRLARDASRASHLFGLTLGVLYFADRPPQEQLLAALDAAGDPVAWAPPLARALALRSYPIWPREEAAEGRLRALAREHDRLSTRGYLESSAAIAAGAPGPWPHVLRAMCLSSVANGAPRGTRCDPRALADVAWDLYCARAAAPGDPSVALYWLHWAPDRLSETVDELLAMGFLGNREALLRHYQRDKVDEALKDVGDLFPRDMSAEEVRRAVSRLRQGERAPLLALTLATLAAERAESGPEEEDLPAPGASGLAQHPEATWHAQARAALVLGRAGRPELLLQAGECALKALAESSPGGEAWRPAPGALLAPGVLPRLPADHPQRETLVPSTLPALPTLGDVLTRLRRPEDALDALTRAWEALHPGPQGPPCAPPLVGFPRGLALLIAPQESPVQERLAPWLLGAAGPEEALLGGLRAAAFSRAEPPARVLHRLARERLRAPALLRDGEERLAGLRLALWLAREAKAVSRFPDGHGALLALLELDLAALGPAEEAPPRVAWARAEAQTAFAARDAEVDPWLAAWALVRASVAGDEAPPPDALERLRDPRVQDLLRKELGRDPLRERLRAVEELRALMAE